jgi:hypothetical protein
MILPTPTANWKPENRGTDAQIRPPFLPVDNQPDHVARQVTIPKTSSFPANADYWPFSK